MVYTPFYTLTARVAAVRGADRGQSQQRKSDGFWAIVSAVDSRDTTPRLKTQGKEIRLRERPFRKYSDAGCPSIVRRRSCAPLPRSAVG